MHLPVRTEEVKEWIVTKLEDISDADSDVLADYVIALLAPGENDEPPDKIRASCLENLEDFLKEETKTFVDELFQKIGQKSVIPAQHPNKQPVRPVFPENSHLRLSSATNGRLKQPGIIPRKVIAPTAPTAGLKRTFTEHYESQNFPQRSVTGGPPRRKHARHAQRKDQPAFLAPFNGNKPPFYPSGPMPQPSFSHIAPPFDSNDPMMFMIAMQTMMQQMTDTMRMHRCFDYDTKGHCTRGNSCPFKHGEDKTVATVADSPDKKPRPKKHDRRADFSDSRPSSNRSNTSLVVERIPTKALDEARVRDFFSQYGKVLEVDIRPYKNLAVVKFEKYASARQAFESPKVVLDNRFIKVFWYKADENRSSKGRRAMTSLDDEMPDAEEMDIDPEAFAAQQRKAQKAFEEKAAKMAEVIEQRKNLRERLEQHYARMKDLEERLARAERRKTGGSGANGELEDGTSSPEITTNDRKAVEKAKVQQALREQLALLEAEAKSLGIDPAAPQSPYDTYSFSYSRSWRSGRSGYRDRGGGRGGYHLGHAHHGSPAISGAVLRLDNRPRRIAISLRHDAVFDPAKDEALRHHLLTISDFESIEQDPEKAQGGGIIVTYSDRWKAEMVIEKGRDIPGVGIVDMKWIPHSPESADADSSKTITPQAMSRASSASATRGSGRGDDEDGDDEMSEGEVDKDMNGAGNGDGAEERYGAKPGSAMGSHIFSFEADANYDVASDDEGDGIT